MTIQLVVKNFSCITDADIALNSITVIIGPQASGKSILSKLIYFFNQLIHDQFLTIEDGQSLQLFKTQLRTQFMEWFPIEAWGQKKFSIEFSAGEFQVRLTRVERNGKPGDNVRIWLSSFFETQYDETLALMERLKKSESADPYVEGIWKVREPALAALKEKMGVDYFDYQLFIPAGRSFFTSIGKSIAAFEYGRVLDPLTMRFGRYFANLRERGMHLRVPPRASPWLADLNAVMGGDLVFERNREYLKTSDGRKVPISALSSGQQELMPLLMTMKARVTSRRFRQLITIEEPEAHLFPAAQSVLVEALASMLNSQRGDMSLVVTTHSPYVLAKINNLIKAQQVALQSEEDAAKVARIVTRRAWMPLSMVSAYAICNGTVVSIVDKVEQLLDGSYLDGVSGDISRQFSALLELEAI